MKGDYHRTHQDYPPFIREEYYKVVEETAPEGFTAEKCYKVVKETASEGFTAEEYYKITEGPEQADSLEDLDKAPEGEGTLRVKEEEVVNKVCAYFSETIFCRQDLSPVCKASFPVGPAKNCEADVVLRGSESQPFVAIAECKGSNGANYGRQQLWGYLSANNTRFGLFANSLNPDEWIFYENLRHFRFRLIKRSQFENEVIAGNHCIETAGSRTAGFTKNPNLGTLDREQLSEDKVESEVRTYLSKIISQTWEYSLEQNYKIQIGSEKEPRIADFVLRGRDGSFIAIVDTKYREFENVKGTILNTLLSATDTKFGIIAHSVDRDQWKFVEKSGINIFNNLKRAVFEAMAVAQVGKTSCPMKDEIFTKPDWEQHHNTWKDLNAERIWRVTHVPKVFHTDFPFKVGDEISDTEYEQACKNYLGCSVKKGDILTEARLAKIHEIWPDLVIEHVWRVTGVFHSGCPFTVGQYISQVEYEQVQVDYLGCPVKKGDILTKAELTKHRKTWNNLKVEKIWCITDTDYQQAQQWIRGERDQSQFVIRFWQSIWSIAALECGQVLDERDKSQSKIKLWQFITAGVGLFLVCFGMLFLVQRNAIEDAVHQIAVLASQLTQKESEIRRKDWEIQSLTTSVQTLKSENETLSEKISELENQEKNKTFPTDKSVVNLQKQLNERRNENQELKKQLVEKDTEIQQLRNDKSVVLNENRRLQNQLTGSNSETINQNATVQRLQNEKTAVLNENRRLQTKNQDLVHRNQELQNENKALQDQLDSAKQSDSNQVKKLPSPSGDSEQHTVRLPTANIVAEPPEKIQDYSEVITRARSHNNQGCLDFERNDYDEALKQFERVTKDYPKLAIAHYNLGCAYLEMKKYTGAIDAFDKAVALDQKFKEAYYNRSIAYFRISRFQEAKLDATKALDIDSHYQLAEELLTAVKNVQQ